MLNLSLPTVVEVALGAVLVLATPTPAAYAFASRLAIVGIVVVACLLNEDIRGVAHKPLRLNGLLNIAVTRILLIAVTGTILVNLIGQLVIRYQIESLSHRMLVWNGHSQARLSSLPSSEQTAEFKRLEYDFRANYAAQVLIAYGDLESLGFGDGLGSYNASAGNDLLCPVASTMDSDSTRTVTVVR